MKEGFHEASKPQPKKHSGWKAALAFLGALAISPMASAAQRAPGNSDFHAAVHQKEKRMRETLQSLGGSGLYSGLNLSGVRFQDLLNSKSNGSAMYSGVPNLHDPKAWMERGNYLWKKGTCGKKVVAFGLDIDNPSGEVKTMTEPWDESFSFEELPGGVNGLKEWVRKVCGTGHIS